MPNLRAQPLRLSRVQGLCDVDESSDQYRRRARRLRHTLRNHPSRLHSSLARLFEANLILAIEQNRRKPLRLEERSRNWNGILTVTCIALLQSLMLIGAWWILRA